jgi:hypothetical protein
MTYIIDGIKFDLSKPINKYWYSKFKKSILKNKTDYILIVLSDVKNKNKIKYSPQYYACAKFIKYTTGLKFTKEQINLYWIRTLNDDFDDTFNVDNKDNLVCSRINKLKLKLNNETLWGGKKIGECENGCCKYYCKTKKFYIRWI